MAFISGVSMMSEVFVAGSSPGQAEVARDSSTVREPPFVEEAETVLDGTTPPGRLVTTVQAADLLAVSVRTVRNLMHDGKLHYVKVGRATRIDPADV